MSMNFSKAMNKQSGAALLVALVILLVISILGTASMRTSTMEMKMANSQRDRDASFAAAEAALIATEEWLELNPPQFEQLIDSCGSGSTCFDASCAGGLCFDGAYGATDDEIDCVVGDSTGATQRTEFWSDSSLDVWNDSAKHKTLSLDGIDEEIKYIVEFLCYVAPDNTVTFNPDPGNRDNGRPLYRITALAEGNGDRSKVMLQSTYMLVNS